MKRLAKMVSCMLVAMVVVCCMAHADDIPRQINFQGSVSVEGQAFSGLGQFKFAFVNLNGTTTYWSNDNTSANGSEPANGIAVEVLDGIYSVALGGQSMTPIPESVFTAQGEVYLRVWFDDGTHGFEMLAPDQRILAVAYAFRAAVADNAANSSRTVIEGELDTEDPGDEILISNSGDTFAVKNIPIADLDITDMPIINIYWAHPDQPDQWYDDRKDLFYQSNSFNITPYYIITNGYIKFAYYYQQGELHSFGLNARIPFLGSTSHSYNILYKIVIDK